MTCALISSKERKIYFFSQKDIVVVMISVHSNRPEIEKQEEVWGRGYTGGIHTDREYRDTHSHCSLPDSTQKLSRKKRVTDIVPERLPSSPDVPILKYADCCLATKTLPAGVQSFG